MKNIIAIVIIFFITVFVMIKNPQIHKAVQISNAQYIFQNSKSIKEEITTQKTKEETTPATKTVQSREDYMNSLKNRAEKEYGKDFLNPVYEEPQPPKPAKHTEKTTQTKQSCGSICMLNDNGIKICKEIPCETETKTPKTTAIINTTTEQNKQTTTNKKKSTCETCNKKREQIKPTYKKSPCPVCGKSASATRIGPESSKNTTVKKTTVKKDKDTPHRRVSRTMVGG